MGTLMEQEKFVSPSEDMQRNLLLETTTQVGDTSHVKQIVCQEEIMSLKREKNVICKESVHMFNETISNYE